MPQQLGVGTGSGYPNSIDTRQVFANGASAAPDSSTRVDAEVLNDMLDAHVKVQSTLGANPQGVFGSLAARLNQYLPGGGASPSSIPFSNALTLTIPGTVHRLGTGTLLYRIYDNSIPAAALSPDAFTVTVNPANYDVTVNFVQQQSGFIVLSSATPLYTVTFANSTGLTIAGTAHQLGTPNLFWQIYDAGSPQTEIQPATLTVHPSSFDVTIGFDTPSSGTVVLSAAGPRYVATFSGQTTVSVPGATHALGTQALLWGIYDNATPRSPVEPETFTVDPSNYNVTATFGSAQSGTLVLAAVPAGTGTDFEIRDAGIANTSATIVKSASGNLILQQGTGNHTLFRDKNGTTRADLDSTGKLGLGGTLNPTFELQLATDSAAKPATSTWTIASDERLKEVLRPFTDGLAVVRQLHAVIYRYNGKGGMRPTRDEHIGYLAQAIQAIAPYMVTSRKGKLTPDDTQETDLLDYNGHALVFILVNAIQELTARLVALEALPGRLERLEARVHQLEAAAASAEDAAPC
jgi:hypothetical protein